MTPDDALKRIEESHRKRSDDPEICLECWDALYPCDVVKLALALRDVLSSVEARRKLDAGFGGMGVNITQETASRIHLHVRQANRVLTEVAGGDDE